MNEDRGIGAMPKLYGAPAYARPPALPVNPVDRPFDPDDLPLEAHLTSEEREVAGVLEPRSYETTASTEAAPADSTGTMTILGRPFRLRLPGR